MVRPPAESFEDLIVWQKSHHLTLFVYRVTTGFPKTELYGLVSQMRRAAVSVPANIAEGFKAAEKSRIDEVVPIAQRVHPIRPEVGGMISPTSYLLPPTS